MEHGRLAQPEDRNVDDRFRLHQAGILEMADGEGVIAFFLGARGILHHLHAEAHFRDRMHIGRRRIQGVDDDLGARIGDRPEMVFQTIQIGLRFVLVGEALIPDSHDGLVLWQPPRPRPGTSGSRRAGAAGDMIAGHTIGRLVPMEGLEPPTHALRMRCSTD